MTWKLRERLLEIARLCEHGKPHSVIARRVREALKELEALPSAERARMDLEQRTAQRRANGVVW